MSFEADPYIVALTVVGVAALGSALVPRLLAYRPISFPLVYLAAGLALFGLLPLESVDPREHTELAERLTELAMIVALFGVGLKLERRVSFSGWRLTWRLIGITMPLTIAAAAALGWWLGGLAPATALLLGAISAPTDPVLASDVQSGEPRQTMGEGRVRFALTSETGFNDGLAFPFTNAAIAMAGAGAASEWLASWAAVDVLYRVTVGIGVGVAVGWVVAYTVFELTVGETTLAQTCEGLVAVAVTLLTYGFAELAQGYGFLAVFAAALTIREFERDHEYHRVLHWMADQAERFVVAVVLLLLGGAIIDGLLASLTWQLAAVGLAIVLLVRPLLGLVGLAGMDASRWERFIIAFFGIRGIGTLYYIAHATKEAEFAQSDQLWALAGFIVVVSVVIHGLSATPVMRRFDRECRRNGDTGREREQVGEHAM